MRRYLLDSNALNLFVYRRDGVFERAVDARRSGAVIGTGVPVVAETLGGTLASATWEVNLPRVEQVLSTLRLWPFDVQAAREYGRLYAVLRRVGVRMQVVDLMIAAIALTVPNCTVVTSDSDFTRVPGLTVESWGGVPGA
jgi:tRNA(fMet)-specific endonuclease VapC